MKTLTIFTPTYNRAYILGNLYQSLLKQTCQDFQWLVVDDGSTDNTEELLSLWSSEGKIDMQYIRQANGGKMRAHNVAVAHADTELFMCCDSDDFLTEDAVEVLLSRWRSYTGDREHISGLISPKTIICAGKEKIFDIPANIDTITLKELHQRTTLSEANLTLRTDILRKYPFQVQEGEKFITEDSVFHLLDRCYRMLFFYDKTMICEYQEDGYSFNLDKVMRANPKGYAYYYDILSEDEENAKRQNEYLKEYITFSRMAGYSNVATICRSSLPLKTLIRMIRMKLHERRNK